jgi:hypothetical protein
MLSLLGASVMADGVQCAESHVPAQLAETRSVEALAASARSSYRRGVDVPVALTLPKGLSKAGDGDAIRRIASKYSIDRAALTASRFKAQSASGDDAQHGGGGGAAPRSSNTGIGIGLPQSRQVAPSRAPHPYALYLPTGLRPQAVSCCHTVARGR